MLFVEIWTVVDGFEVIIVVCSVVLIWSEQVSETVPSPVIHSSVITPI